MPIVGSAFGDYVHGRAFATPVGRGETLRADIEFLNSPQWELHDRAADSVVFVIDAVHRDVHVAATRAIDPEYGNAVFRGVV